ADGFPIAATYTFAAPRPGDAQFAASIGSEVHRIEFGDDIVPHVPMKLGWPKLFKDAVNLARVAGDVGEMLRSLADVADPSYEPPGRLSYAMAVEPPQPRFDISEDEDEHLAKDRRAHLIFAGKNLVGHHHMYNYLHYVLNVSMDDA